jgi:hypothetical protein
MRFQHARSRRCPHEAGVVDVRVRTAAGEPGRGQAGVCVLRQAGGVCECGRHGFPRRSTWHFTWNNPGAHPHLQRMRQAARPPRAGFLPHLSRGIHAPLAQ